MRLADGTDRRADAGPARRRRRAATRLADRPPGSTSTTASLVDASLRTSDPDVFAVGDVANTTTRCSASAIRVEHWANALNQPGRGRSDARRQDDVYDRLPYFFTDQYDLGMEYVGYAEPGGYDRVVVRGDLGGREFVAFWLDGEDRVLAAMNVNVWDVADEVKPLIAGRTVVDPDKLADPAVPLAQVGR